MRSMQGIFPALVTPFDGEGQVDEGALRRLVSAGIESGVAGFYVCGSTAECFLLGPDERKRILEAVLGETAGRAAVICHVGAISTDFSVELGRHAAAAGVDAVSSIPPFYYKFSVEEILGYYEDLVERIGAPLIPYNFPALSGVTLTADHIRRLRKDPRVIGVKFTSSDFFQLERMKREDPGLVVYSGFDEMFLAGLSMGADGAIGSTFNIMAGKFIRIARLFAAGDHAGAKAEQAEANEVIQAILATGKSLNAHKYLLGLQGLSCGECRRPFLPLTESDRSLLDVAARRFLGIGGGQAGA